MTAPCSDPAFGIVTAFLTAMREAFDPAGDCPPDGGGSTDVRFFAGDGALPAWNPQDDCGNPFLWVRVAHRFRSRGAEFPAAFVGTIPCGGAGVTRALAVEVGVGRCTSMDIETDWETLAKEAEISLDDSWRIELALCRAASFLRGPERGVAIDTVAPFGPEGGIVAWTGMAYVQF